MPTVKLTKATIERIKAPDPSGKQKLIWDAELKGFGVLVSGATNSKSYVCQRTLPDGRSRRMTIGSVREIDLDRARAEAADLIHEMRSGDPKAKRRSAANWTLRRALDEYVRARKDIKPSTATYYRKLVEANLSAWLDRPIAGITPEEVEERHRKIAAEVARRQKARPENWASSPGGVTANQVFTIFGSVWGFLADRVAEMPANPTRRLRRQKFAQPRRERLVRADEMPAFYRAVQQLKNPVSRDFVTLLLFTGMRRSEAAALRWDEVDFANRLIRLPAKRTKSGRKLDLPLSTYVRDLLVARRAIGVERGGWVFPSDSRSGHLEAPAPTFELIAEQCGIRVSAHDLRRTYITVAESCDISPLSLKALVNHAVGGDVTAGYVILVSERLREPAQRICNRLMQLCGIAEPAGENVASLVR